MQRTCFCSRFGYINLSEDPETGPILERLGRTEEQYCLSRRDFPGMGMLHSAGNGSGSNSHQWAKNFQWRFRRYSCNQSVFPGREPLGCLLKSQTQGPAPWRWGETAGVKRTEAILILGRLIKESFYPSGKRAAEFPKVRVAPTSSAVCQQENLNLQFHPLPRLYARFRDGWHEGFL